MRVEHALDHQAGQLGQYRRAAVAHDLPAAQLLGQLLVGHRQQPAAVFDQLRDGAQRRSANQVEHGVHAGRCRRGPDPVQHPVPVGDGQHAEPGEQFVLGRARGPDDPQPARHGELPDADADPAAGPVHQQGRTARQPEVLQCVVGGPGRDRQHRGHLRRHRFGPLRRERRGHQRLFGPTADHAGAAAEDLVADGEPAHPRAEPGHRSRHLAAEDRRPLDAVRPLAQPPVARVHPGRADPDQQLIRPGLGHRHIEERLVLRPTDLAEPVCPHDIPPRDPGASLARPPRIRDRPGGRDGSPRAAAAPAV